MDVIIQLNKNKDPEETSIQIVEDTKGNCFRIEEASNTDYLTEKILHLIVLAIDYKTGIFFFF